MLFNSFTFLIFFIVVTTLFFILPHRFRWIHLLIASCVFYSYFIPIYLLILFFTIIIDYIAGIQIEKTEGDKRKQFLILSLIANIGILVVFKYYNFFVGNVNEILDWSSSPYHLKLMELALPIGLSFHTFQAMSYTIEVYRGNQKAEKNFGVYALYVMFYPQLVAGPIERPQNILHQFYIHQQFNYSNAVRGLRLILWGLFKKVVVADNLSPIVDLAYKNTETFSSAALLCAVFLFSFQIYCDFSGYSDIAIGTARFMGFELMKNFNIPYYAKSLSEFWSRWHISLSTWFRDYLYIPLGGNKASGLKVNRNIFIVFLVSGFWHGANWTFVLWGFLHGFFTILGRYSKPLRLNLIDLVSFGNTKVKQSLFPFEIALNFILVSFIWVFFRAETIQHAVNILKGIVLNPFINGNPTTFKSAFFSLISELDLDISKLIVILFSLLIMEVGHFVLSKNSGNAWLEKHPMVLRWAVYFILLFMILVFGNFNSQQFIYFQF